MSLALVLFLLVFGYLLVYDVARALGRWWLRRLNARARTSL